MRTRGQAAEDQGHVSAPPKSAPERPQQQYALDSVKVIRSVGAVTRERYLEMFLEMEERYPSKGWRQEMDKLERHYADRGASLKEIAGGPLALVIKRAVK